MANGRHDLSTLGLSGLHSGLSIGGLKVLRDAETAYGFADASNLKAEEELFMKLNARQTVRWNTSAFGGTPDPSSAELSELTSHLQACLARGRMFSLRWKIVAMNGIFASRLMTVVVVVALLFLFVSLAFAA